MSDIERIQYQICLPTAIADGLPGSVPSTRFAVLLGSSTLSNIRRVAASLRCMSNRVLIKPQTPMYTFNGCVAAHQ